MDDLIRGSPQLNYEKDFPKKNSNTNISIEDLNTFLCAQKPHIFFFHIPDPYSPILQKTDRTKRKLISISQHKYIHEKPH